METRAMALPARLMCAALASTLAGLAGCSEDGAEAAAPTDPREYGVASTDGAEAPAEFVRGRILVAFHEDVPAEAARAAVAKAGGRILDQISQIGVFVVGLPENADERAHARAFQNRPDVDFSDVDDVAVPTSIVPNDPNFKYQWQMTRIAAPEAWELTQGSPGVTIAILDTGVMRHEDLVPNLVPGWNLLLNNSNTSDDGFNRHGTLVAGAAAAAGNNGLGMAGVAWNCRIMPVVIGSPTASASTIAKGLTYAADHGARVANISFNSPGGGLDGNRTVSRAAKYFTGNGGVVVMAAGNDGAASSVSDNANIVVVGGSDTDDIRVSYSNYGRNLDLLAPSFVYTTWRAARSGSSADGGIYIRGDFYGEAGGTSFASPLVAGVAALMISANPSIAPRDVISTLQRSAEDLGAAGWDAGTGWGRVDAGRAVKSVLQAMAGPDLAPPSLTLLTPTAGSTVAGTIPVSMAASDSSGMRCATFKLDGRWLGSDFVAPFGMDLDTNRLSNGAHTFEVTAWDSAGNSATVARAVTVLNGSDTLAPSVAVWMSRIVVTGTNTQAYVSGTAVLQLESSDNWGVAALELWVDGVLQGAAAAPSREFRLDTRGMANGPHALSARARDVAGHTRSAAFTLTVDNQAPQVSILSPADGSSISGSVEVRAATSDNTEVKVVTLYVDGVMQSNPAVAPNTFLLDTRSLANGTHRITVKVYDLVNTVGTASISVVVGN